MNILFIGNSFSEDATRYLQKIADGSLFVRNLFVGNSSLEKHWENFETDKRCYQYQNDTVSTKASSIRQALLDQKWDFVSLQQCSDLSGFAESYEPYVGNLIQEIKAIVPETAIVLHKTWAYEDGSTHKAFPNYGNDRTAMFRAIEQAVGEITKKYGLPTIPNGNAVEEARTLEEFAKGGRYRITRDGYHLSMDYGRYLAGLVCYGFFTKQSAQEVTFEPKKTDHAINQKLKQIADQVLAKAK